MIRDGQQTLPGHHVAQFPFFLGERRRIRHQSNEDPSAHRRPTISVEAAKTPEHIRCPHSCFHYLQPLFRGILFGVVIRREEDSWNQEVVFGAMYFDLGTAHQVAGDLQRVLRSGGVAIALNESVGWQAVAGITHIMPARAFDAGIKGLVAVEALEFFRYSIHQVLAAY